MAADADVVIGAGDFASFHRGLEQLIDMLVVIETPTVLVPGNNETLDDLRRACGGWPAATVLHGSGAEIGGGQVSGRGGGGAPRPWAGGVVPTEEEARG